ncbi:MAG: hypothetical protein U0105_20630, partial [Candidatus Obscuribacterales bacterium]
MSVSQTEDYPKTANEPKVHSLIKDSFVFVPSAGMRTAPEVLILELMREVFYTTHHGGTSATKDINPNEQAPGGTSALYSVEERAVLYALGGRRKKSASARTQQYFAPAFPSLAKEAWLGKNRERVVYNFLLSGPLSQHLWGSGANTERGSELQKKLIETICKALIGNNAGSLVPDILAGALKSQSYAGDDDLPRKNLKEGTSDKASVIRIERDELADRITDDFVAICELEVTLPRMQWLQLLMTYLRFALPMWVLAQMKITTLLHNWLIEAADDGTAFDESLVTTAICRRNRSLLHPTVTPTRELFDHIERYVKARIETNLLLYALEKTNPGGYLAGRKLVLRQPSKTGEVGVADLLILCKDASEEISGLDWFKETGAHNTRTFLTREAEQFSGWRNPRKHGQGKNIDEFFLLLYKAAQGDEIGGHLLLPEGRGVSK